MDDIDLIREFGSDYRGPDAEETARVRGTVMERVGEAAAKAGAATNLVGVEADRAAMRAAGVGLRPVVRRHGIRRRWILAAGVAAAIVAAAVIVPALMTNGPLGGVQSAAAEALSKVAGVAADQQAAATPTAGQFVYTKTRAVWESSWYGAGPQHDQNFSVLMPVVRQAWIGTDGSGRLLETNGAPTFVTQQDRAAWVAAGRPSLGTGQISDEAYGKGGLSYVDLTNLPTDAAQLRTMIEQRKIEGGPAGDAETFTIIGDLLRETYAPPALRAALYQVASELPGVELIGTVKDDAGRSGIAVGYTSHGTRQELIFDPTTAALLGERSVVVDPVKAKMHVAAGTVMSLSTYLASGVVDSTSQKPQL